MRKIAALLTTICLVQGCMSTSKDQEDEMISNNKKMEAISKIEQEKVLFLNNSTVNYINGYNYFLEKNSFSRNGINAKLLKEMLSKLTNEEFEKVIKKQNIDSFKETHIEYEIIMNEAKVRGYDVSKFHKVPDYSIEVDGNKYIDYIKIKRKPFIDIFYEKPIIVNLNKWTNFYKSRESSLNNFDESNRDDIYEDVYLKEDKSIIVEGMIKFIDEYTIQANKKLDNLFDEKLNWTTKYTKEDTDKITEQTSFDDYMSDINYLEKYVELLMKTKVHGWKFSPELEIKVVNYRNQMKQRIYKEIKNNPDGKYVRFGYLLLSELHRSFDFTKEVESMFFMTCYSNMSNNYSSSNKLNKKIKLMNTSAKADKITDEDLNAMNEMLNSKLATKERCFKVLSHFEEKN